MLCKRNDCKNKYNGPNKEGGLCREHYLEATKDKKYTLLTKHGRPKNEQLCKVEECSKKYYCLDFCRPHYLKYKKYGDPLKVVHKTTHGDSCAVLGCLEPYYINDYCQKHYWRNQRYGSPYITHKNNENSGKCGIDGCKRKYYAKDLCKNHYMIFEYARSGSQGDLILYNAMNRVRKRDNNSCQWYKCRKSSKKDHIIIHVHHIFPKSEYPDLMYKEEYMICYCKFHHSYWHEMRGDLGIAGMLRS